jgi:hypothetical protein
LLFLLFALPVAFYFAQNRLAEYALNYLSSATGFEYSVGRFRLDFFGEIYLQNVLIRDREKRNLIRVKELRVEFSPIHVWSDGEIIAERAYICGAAVNLWYHKDNRELNINEWIASFDRLKSDTTRDTTYSRFVLKIPEIKLEDSYFSFNDVTADSLPRSYFDYYHFELSKLNAKIKDFRVADDTIELYADRLQAIEPNLFWTIHGLSTFFRYRHEAMTFDRLDLKLGQSHLKGFFGMYYESMKDFLDFNNKVRLRVNLEKSLLGSRDLAYFTNFFSRYDRVFTVDGSAEGVVSNLRTENISVHLGGSQTDFGSMHFVGLPDTDLATMNINLKRSTIFAQDILHFVPLEYHSLVRKLGKISYTGAFDGTSEDFLTNGDFITNLGKVNAKLKMNLLQKKYDGSLSLINFDIGKWTDEQDLGKLTMRGDIRGSGYLKKDAHFTLNAFIDSLAFMGYTYKNIGTNGLMRYGVFEGSADIFDENLKLHLEGLLDLNEEKINIDADLRHIRLKALKFLDSELEIGTEANINLTGFGIDEAVGKLDFRNNRLKIENKTFLFDSLVVLSERTGEERLMKVNCDYFDLSTEGIFNISRLYNEIYGSTKHYLRYVNDTLMPPELNIADTSMQMVNIDFAAKNLNPILHAFVDSSAYVSPEAYLSGQLLLEKEWQLFINGGADSLTLNNNLWFKKLYFETSANKNRKKAPIHAELAVQSERAKIFAELKDMDISAELDNELINFSGRFDAKNTNDTLAFHGNFDFSRPQWLLTFVPDTVRVLDYDWIADNEIVIGILPNRISFEKSAFFRAGVQEFGVTGALDKNPLEQFAVHLSKFDVNILSKFIGYKIGGEADLDFALSNPFGSSVIATDLLVRNLRFEETSLGELSLSVHRKDSLSKFTIDGGIKQGYAEILALDGFLDLNNDDEQLDAVVKIVNGKFNMIQPFVKDILSDLRGNIFGMLSVKGKLASPRFDGEAFVSKGGFKIDYLNTDFRFDDKIRIRPDGIFFENVKLRDRYGKLATIDGGLLHDNYENFRFDMRGTLNNVLCLNTSPKDNSLYYGTAYATGTWKMTGNFAKIDIEVNLRSENDTKFYLPIGGAEATESSFIRFKKADFSLDSLVSAQFRQKNISETNIKTILNFDIAPSAYMEIIFDQKAGDIIRGNATGKMKMIIDTEGDFRMYGDMEIVKGKYNFTFMNFINKEFDVAPGSSITWDGNPYGANLNITANYRQVASLGPIIIGADSTILKRPEIRRKYPVIVDLFLRGDLMSPDISFDIEIRDYPTTIVAGGAPIMLDANVQAFKQLISSNEQELNRQVFSLIVMKRLSEPNNMIAGINQTAMNNLSELLTNQLSAWLSQVDDNLQIDIDLNGLSQEALSTLQLRLSYTFWDKRMRLTREGTFTNVRNETNFSSVLGDWILEYNLSKDGRLRLKAYYRNNFTNYDVNLQSNANSGGSLVYVFSFDNLAEVFQKKSKGKSKRKVVVAEKIEEF